MQGRLPTGRSSEGERDKVEGSPNADRLNLEDTLGEFIKSDYAYLNRTSWYHLFNKVKGRSNFLPRLHHLDHKACSLLLRYAKNGVLVIITSEPWKLDEKDAAMLRGNHPSTAAFSDFITTEMTDMRSIGMFVILPYDAICHFKSL